MSRNKKQKNAMFSLYHKKISRDDSFFEDKEIEKQTKEEANVDNIIQEASSIVDKYRIKTLDNIEENNAEVKQDDPRSIDDLFTEASNIVERYKIKTADNFETKQDNISKEAKPVEEAKEDIENENNLETKQDDSFTIDDLFAEASSIVERYKTKTRNIIEVMKPGDQATYDYLSKETTQSTITEEDNKEIVNSENNLEVKQDNSNINNILQEASNIVDRYRIKTPENLEEENKQESSNHDDSLEVVKQTDEIKDKNQEVEAVTKQEDVSKEAKQAEVDNKNSENNLEVKQDNSNINNILQEVSNIVERYRTKTPENQEEENKQESLNHDDSLEIAKQTDEIKDKNQEVKLDTKQVEEDNKNSADNLEAKQDNSSINNILQEVSNIVERYRTKTPENQEEENKQESLNHDDSLEIAKQTDEIKDKDQEVEADTKQEDVSIEDLSKEAKQVEEDNKEFIDHNGLKESNSETRQEENEDLNKTINFNKDEVLKAGQDIFNDEANLTDFDDLKEYFSQIFRKQSEVKEIKELVSNNEEVVLDDIKENQDSEVITNNEDLILNEAKGSLDNDLNDNVKEVINNEGEQNKEEKILETGFNNENVSEFVNDLKQDVKDVSKETQKPVDKQLAESQLNKQVDETGEGKLSDDIKEVGSSIANLFKNIKRRARKRSQKHKRRFKLSDLVNVVLVVCLLALSGTYFYFFYDDEDNDSGINYSSDQNKQESQQEVVESSQLSETKLERFRKAFLESQSKAKYVNDYKCQIIFESEIINEPVLQGKTNETYLRMNYETGEYDVCGPVFLEATCNLEEDSNLVLYGHNRSTSIDPNHVMSFSPLHLLENKENYNENKTIYLVYEDHVDRYLVVSVYDVQVEEIDGVQYLLEDEPLYYVNNYSDEEFAAYLKAVKARQKYDTGVSLTNKDELLTLQTCYENDLNKLIVLAKKVDTQLYEE